MCVALWVLTRAFKDQPSNGSILVGLQLLADPGVVKAMSSMENVIERFRLSFCSSEEVYTKFLIAFLNSFVEVLEFERSAGVFREATKARGLERWLVVTAAGRRPESEAAARNIVADISVARKLYQAEQDYEEDFRQFNAIVNRESRTIPNHSSRLTAWIECGFPESYEEFLDSEITGAIRGWLTGKGLFLGGHLKTGHTGSLQNRP